MCTCGGPFGHDLGTMSDAVSDLNIQIGNGGHSNTFARHDCLPAYERCAVHAVFDHGMIGIVLMESTRVALILMGKMLLVKLQVL